VNPCDWWRALLVLAYTSGLRKGDLFDIHAHDIDLDSGTMWFTANKTHKADEWPLHPVTVEHIARIIRPGKRLFEGMGATGGRFYKEFHTLQDAAGVSRFGLHDLRRTAASEVERVQRGLGSVFLQHASRNVSERFYLNAVDELREAIEAMRLPAGFKSGPKMAARAEAKAREPLQIRAAEFHAPLGPNPAEWAFDHGAFQFRGVWFRLSGKRLEILRELVTAGGPVTAERIQEITGSDRTQLAISDVRKRLREALGLPSRRDPLPCVDRGSGGVWTLHIPPDVNPVEPAKIPRTGPRRPVSTITAEQLREGREQLGLLQREFAELAGVSTGMVTCWESGRSSIPADCTARLQQVLSRPVFKLAASQLKAARAKAGLSQRLLGAAVGKSVWTVRGWEHGHTPIHSRDAEQLMKVLKIKPTEGEEHDVRGLRRHPVRTQRNPRASQKGRDADEAAAGQAAAG
jgi:DNA-binding transcriptional regulator YiaG